MMISLVIYLAFFFSRLYYKPLNLLIQYTYIGTCYSKKLFANQINSEGNNNNNNNNINNTDL